MVKGLGDVLDGHPLFAGITMRGSGELALIVDVPGLMETKARRGDKAGAVEEHKAGAKEPRRRPATRRRSRPRSRRSAPCSSTIRSRCASTPR